MEVLDQMPFELDTDALLDRLHVSKGSSDEKEVLALAEAAAPIAKPKALYRVSYIDSKGDDQVVIDGVTFTSRVLRVNLEEVERVFPHIATCGTELNELTVPGGDFLQEFWLDTIKEMALGASLSFLNEHVKEKYATGKMSKMSPGAGAHDVWRIEQQRGLFSLLDDVEAAVGVRLTESCLMVPNKSVSGIFYPAEVTFKACQLCPREVCDRRAAPYDPALVESYHGGSS